MAIRKGLCRGDGVVRRRVCRGGGLVRAQAGPCGGCCHLGDACTYARGGSLTACGSYDCAGGYQINRLAATKDDPGAPGYPAKWMHYGDSGTIEIDFEIQCSVRATFAGYFLDTVPTPSAYFNVGQEYTFDWYTRAGAQSVPFPVRYRYAVRGVGDPDVICCETDPDSGACVRDRAVIAKFPAGEGKELHVWIDCENAPVTVPPLPNGRDILYERLLVDGAPFDPQFNNDATGPIDRHRRVTHGFLDGGLPVFSPINGGRQGPCYEQGVSPSYGGSGTPFIAETASSQPVSGCASLVPHWFGLLENLAHWHAPAPVPRFVLNHHLIDPEAFPACGFHDEGAHPPIYPFYRNTPEGVFPIWLVDTPTAFYAPYQYRLASAVDLTPSVGSIDWTFAVERHPGETRDRILRIDAGHPRDYYEWDLGTEPGDFAYSGRVRAAMRVIPDAPCPLPDLPDGYLCCDGDELETVLAQPCDGVGGPIVVDASTVPSGQIPAMDGGSVLGPDGENHPLLKCFTVTGVTSDLDPTPGVFYTDGTGCSALSCRGPVAQLQRCDTGAFFYVPLTAFDDWTGGGSSGQVVTVVVPGFYTGCARVTGTVYTQNVSPLVTPGSIAWIGDPAGCASEVCTGGPEIAPAVACVDLQSGSPLPPDVPERANVDMQGVPGGLAQVVRVRLSPTRLWCYLVDRHNDPYDDVPLLDPRQVFVSCRECLGSTPIGPDDDPINPFALTAPPGGAPGGAPGGPPTDPRVDMARHAEAQLRRQFGCDGCGDPGLP